MGDKYMTGPVSGTQSGTQIVEPKRLMTDLYIEMIDNIIDHIDTCRGQNNSIRERLNFVLNDVKETSVDKDVQAGSPEYSEKDDLLYRLNLINTHLRCLSNEQNTIIERTEI